MERVFRSIFCFLLLYAFLVQKPFIFMGIRRFRFCRRCTIFLHPVSACAACLSCQKIRAKLSQRNKLHADNTQYARYKIPASEKQSPGGDSAFYLLYVSCFAHVCQHFHGCGIIVREEEAFSLVELSDRLHILIAERKIKHIDILLHPVSMRRLGNDHYI